MSGKIIWQHSIGPLHVLLKIFRTDNEETFDELKRDYVSELHLEDTLFDRGVRYANQCYAESHQVTLEWVGDFSPSTPLVMECKSTRECIEKHVKKTIDDLKIPYKYHLAFRTMGEFQEL